MDIHELDIPAAKVGQLQRKGIETIEDLIRRYPKRYNDYRTRISFSDFPQYIGQPVTVVGEIAKVYCNHVKNYVVGHLQDQIGRDLSVMWFNQTYMAQQLRQGTPYLVHGKLVYNDKYKSYSILGPSYYTAVIADADCLQPVYPAVKGMAAAYYQQCLDKAMILFFENPDMMKSLIGEEMEKALGLIPFTQFIRVVHHPRSDEDLKNIELYRAAEILVPFARELAAKEAQLEDTPALPLNSIVAHGDFHTLEQLMPFPLTDDQKTAISVMLQRLDIQKRIHSLVQGDVGCGKTAVAEIIAAIFARQGYQVALMAPTVILAEQHYADFSKIMQCFGFKVCLLTESLAAKQKRAALEEITSGSCKVVIGTSSVLSDKVQFQNLGLVITDEEHRFGVKQREALAEKESAGIHSISMSATPIPRSLALAMNEDGTQIIDIKTMPAGRKAVQTILFGNEDKTYAALYRQIKQGRQCYIVCPLVEDNGSETLTNVDSVEDTYKKATEYYAKNHLTVRIGIITGRTKKTEQQKIIDDFASGKIDILIATTIVEVGVNVPNATVMVIKNAERFGLAQLHQLRGRVGRGSLQSYCVLLSHDKDNARLQTMVKTNDGFEIAKADLEQRGAGNLIGTEQSGFSDTLKYMVAYKDLYKKIRTILKKKPEYKSAC